jgi:hypothetical protein
MLDILRTHQISAAIIDLIEESQQYCFLVTPYFTPWKLLDRALDQAAAQKKRVTLIIRDEFNSSKRQENFISVVNANRNRGFEVIGLNRLHTKLYLNEKTAILGSMNLFDSSSSNNLEAAVRFRGSDALRLKAELIDKELLRERPDKYMAGWFSEDEKAQISKLRDREAAMTSRGFCVTCGTKVDLDANKQIVRCMACWGQNPGPDKYSFKIRHCHYCGGDFKGVLAEPFHHPCGVEVKQFVELKRQYGIRASNP